MCKKAGASTGFFHSIPPLLQSLHANRSLAKVGHFDPHLCFLFAIQVDDVHHALLSCERHAHPRLYRLVIAARLIEVANGTLRIGVAVADHHCRRSQVGDLRAFHDLPDRSPLTGLEPYYGNIWARLGSLSTDDALRLLSSTALGVPGSLWQHAGICSVLVEVQPVTVLVAVSVMFPPVPGQVTLMLVPVPLAGVPPVTVHE
jgi:hypothetical protein